MAPVYRNFTSETIFEPVVYTLHNTIKKESLQFQNEGRDKINCFVVCITLIIYAVDIAGHDKNLFVNQLKG